jgi:cytochrome P450/ferredoxin
MDASTSPAIERIPADFMDHPFELYDRLRAEGPAHQVVMPHGAKAWLITRYDDVRALLIDPRVSKDGRRMNELFARHSAEPVEEDEPADAGFDDDLSAHMMNSDPPRHTRLRTLVSKAFTARRMEDFRPRIERVVDELLDRMADLPEVDLVTAFTMPLPITLIFDLLGIPHEDRAAFQVWATQLVGAGHDPAEVAEASRQVVDFANALIDAKRVNPGEDLVSALVRVTDQGDRLTQSELVAMIFLLVVAGSETPMHQLGNAVYSLLTHPDELAKLRGDPSLIPAAVDELMRFDGGVGTASFRFTAAEITVGDVVIPAGEIIVLSLSAANRDPAHFAEPDRLDLNRHPVGGLAFGHGVHYCIGAPLARLTLEIGLQRLITRYPDLRLAVGPQQLRWKSSSLVRGLVTLPVSVKRGRTWRVTVNDTCVGSGSCIGIAPRHFRLDEDDRSHPVDAEVAPDDLVRAAATCCPMEAIVVTDTETGASLKL